MSFISVIFGTKFEAYGGVIVAVEGNPEAKSPDMVVGVVYPAGLVGVTVTTA